MRLPNNGSGDFLQKIIFYHISLYLLASSVVILGHFVHFVEFASIVHYCPTIPQLRMTRLIQMVEKIVGMRLSRPEGL